ncbi:antibiotic biosynthesis monooxygenase [Vibrio campbellii]|uniref:putative quinol monooxygenase n=1 Tax=Vibrio campbellii TaxID=680 RepID=UPI000CF4EF7B|nr:putative quinol monooxygenase [Vibrio campbellii]PQJ42573.1 antibiotic biosynthesis monooxygenase [Vibrio campbellii]
MIHLVAEIKAFPDHIEQVTQLLTELLAPTRQEEGCCQYELYLDEKIEGLFMFQEMWASQEALDKHLQSPHIAQCFSALEKNGLLEYTHIRPMTFVG